MHPVSIVEQVFLSSSAVLAFFVGPKSFDFILINYLSS